MLFFLHNNNLLLGTQNITCIEKKYKNILFDHVSQKKKKNKDVNIIHKKDCHAYFGIHKKTKM